jgi:hypothetical protein
MSSISHVYCNGETRDTQQIQRAAKHAGHRRAMRSRRHPWPPDSLSIFTMSK